jgi:hypothetical protein
MIGARVQVNGEFAETMMEFSCRFDVEQDRLVQDIRTVDNVLSVELTE